MSQDNPYPSQKRKLRLREVAGHLQGHAGGAQWSQDGKSLVKPVTSGHTKPCNLRSQELGRWSVREAEG